MLYFNWQSIDSKWKALHEHAMKNSWKPPASKSDVKYLDSDLGARLEATMPIQKYSFEMDNPYLSKISNRVASLNTTDTLSSYSSVEKQDCDNLYQQGMQCYSDGHVDEAILAFEGAIQLHPEYADNVTVCDNSDMSTAVDEIWNMLGRCHAEMDKDVEAIYCYQQALEHDPFNLSALLALGTSYVNEMNSEKALECLQGWVKHNPKFYGLQTKLKMKYNTDTADDVYSGVSNNCNMILFIQLPHVESISDGSLMDEVLQLMLAVEKFDPYDADVQIVLGVLQNVTQDHRAAANAFRKALSQSPKDFSLLNKVVSIFVIKYLF